MLYNNFVNKMAAEKNLFQKNFHFLSNTYL